MKSYWDSSALVAACLEEAIRVRLEEEGGITRPHAFAEVFSTLTGGRLGFRVDAKEGAVLVRELSDSLEEVGLDAEETLVALEAAKGRGVRGGRVHDYLNAVAARKAGCGEILTLNGGDFEGLCEGIKVVEP